jgi:hypothetical protein
MYTVMCWGYFYIYVYIVYLVVPQLLVHVSVSRTTDWVLSERHVGCSMNRMLRVIFCNLMDEVYRSREGN